MAEISNRQSQNVGISYRRRATEQLHTEQKINRDIPKQAEDFSGHIPQAQRKIAMESFTDSVKLIEKYFRGLEK